MVGVTGFGPATYTFLSNKCKKNNYLGLTSLAGAIGNLARLDWGALSLGYPITLISGLASDTTLAYTYVYGKSL